MFLFVFLLFWPAAWSSECAAVIDAAYPRQYVVGPAPNNEISIDGKLSEKAWAAARWTEDFVDISTTVRPWLRTRAKMLFSKEWLYVAAELQEIHVWANITQTCHCINNTQDQVIFHDNDFEVFVDPAGTTRYYKEFEMNVANATWDLCLNRPYENNGYENSTRVFGKHGFDMVPPLKCATSTDGVINDPRVPASKWTVEIAFPVQKLLYNTSGPLPTPGSYWRINFSRVEWHVSIVGNRYMKTPKCQSCLPVGSPVEDNWVWSPMRAVDMHHPEMWGFLQFANSSDAPAVKNVEWPCRYVAHELYYAQVAFFAATHRYTNVIDELLPFANHKSVFHGVCVKVPKIKLNAAGYVAVVESLDGKVAISINENRLILAEQQ